MLCRLSNDVVPFGGIGLRHSEESEVVRFGGAAGENDFAGSCTNEFGNLPSTDLYRFFGFPPKDMVSTGRVSIIVPKIGKHSIQHPRVEGGRGMVIHVNGKLHD